MNWACEKMRVLVCVRKDFGDGTHKTEKTREINDWMVRLCEHLYQIHWNFTG